MPGLFAEREKALTEYSSIKLGDLLTQVGILKSDELANAIQVAGETGLPIGRVLIMSGYLTDLDLQAAVQVQSLLKDSQMDILTAGKVLALVSKEGVTFEQSLRRVGWVGNQKVQTAKLGELLLAAELVTEAQMNEGLKTSQETGLPLGRILVLTQALTEELLSAALTAQVMVRDGKVTKEQAIEGLRSARRRRVSIEVSLIDHGFYRPPTRQTVKLGELFVLSGLINESDLMNALELGLTREMPVGRVLVESGYITKQILDAALKLQEMVSNGTLNALLASEALRRIAVHQVPISQAVAELGSREMTVDQSMRLEEVLKGADIVTDADIRSAIDTSSRNSALLGKMLLVTGMVDEPTLHAALRAQFLLREGFLHFEQAMIAISYAKKNGVTFDEAIVELGWSVPPRIHGAEQPKPTDQQ